MDTTADRVGALCEVVVDGERSPGELWEALDELHRLLLDVTQLGRPELDPAVGDGADVGGGLAIAPIEAGRCLYDLYRTRAFTGAVVDAIDRRRATDATRPVRVLYAGCGPFASLLLPAMTRFGPSELRVALLDVHRRSVESARRLTAALGAESMIDRIELADAGTYRIPDATGVDIVVAECLQRGLSSEPQVAMMRNLVHQVGPGVTMIPERVSVSLVAAGPRAGLAEPAQHLRRLAPDPVFTLDLGSLRRWGAPTGEPELLAAATVRLSMDVTPPAQLALVLTIDVDGTRRLDDYDSWLTSPHPLAAPPQLRAGSELRLAYDTAQPGFVVLD